MPRQRLLKWFTTLRQLQALADNSQITFDLLTDLAASQTEGATITRILIEMWVRNDIVLEDKTMDWGIVLVAGAAASAGGFPDADIEDERVDWLGRGRMHAITTVIGDGASLGHMERDLRAQRVIRDEFEQLRLILDVDANGTGGLFVTFITRILVRMP